MKRKKRLRPPRSAALNDQQRNGIAPFPTVSPDQIGNWYDGPETFVIARAKDVQLGAQTYVLTQPRAQQALSEMEARKDAAYLERNQVVAALAKCFPSGVARTAIEGWSEDWHGCVYIDLPTGQASWHFHDSQAYLFADLPPYQGAWDGHSTEEKYARIAALKAQQAAAPVFKFGKKEALPARPHACVASIAVFSTCQYRLKYVRRSDQPSS